MESEHFAYLGEVLRRNQGAGRVWGYDEHRETQEKLIAAQREKLRKYLMRELPRFRRELREQGVSGRE